MKYVRQFVISSYTFTVIPWLLITNFTNTKENFKYSDYEKFFLLH